MFAKMVSNYNFKNVRKNDFQLYFQKCSQKRFPIIISKMFANTISNYNFKKCSQKRFPNIISKLFTKIISNYWIWISSNLGYTIVHFTARRDNYYNHWDFYNFIVNKMISLWLFSESRLSLHTNILVPLGRAKYVSEKNEIVEINFSQKNRKLIKKLLKNC